MAVTRVVAVTGGARGVGRAIANAAAKAGANVAIGDIDGVEVAAAAAQLATRSIGLLLDVADHASFTTFLEVVETELGPIDVLVNNAGIMPTGAFEDEPDELTRRIIDINVHGVLNGSKLAARRMLRRGSGHIVNVASGAGYICAPGIVTYCGSKHAVVGITEALRLELGPRGIDVTVVAPGVIDTELTSGLPDVIGMGRVPPEVVARAVVRAFDHPRAAVFAPRRVAVISTVAKLLPARARDALFAVAGAGGGYLDTDATARAPYMARVLSAAHRS